MPNTMLGALFYLVSKELQSQGDTTIPMEPRKTLAGKHGVWVCTGFGGFRNPQQLSLKLWWKTEEMDSPLCENISRGTVSGRRISAGAPEAAFRLHVASWLGCLGHGSEVATVHGGALRPTDTGSFKVLLTASFKDRAPHPGLREVLASPSKLFGK